MKELDPGHKYQVDVYDGEGEQVITFMKREGEGYPRNIGHYPGTNCQEVIRTLLKRTRFLDSQYAHLNNKAIIRKLQECLWLFEDRAASRHNIDQFDFRPDDIEDAGVCFTCGHVICPGHV